MPPMKKGEAAQNDPRLDGDLSHGGHDHRNAAHRDMRRRRPTTSRRADIARATRRHRRSSSTRKKCSPASSRSSTTSTTVLAAARAGARRRLSPLGRAQPVPDPRHGRRDGHPPDDPAWLVADGRRHRAARAGSRCSGTPTSIDYPFFISGKPLVSLPAFIPVIFELTIAVRGVHGGVRDAGAEQAADALQPAVQERAFPPRDATTGSSSSSTRPTRSSTRRRPRSCCDRSNPIAVERFED